MSFQALGKGWAHTQFFIWLGIPSPVSSVSSHSYSTIGVQNLVSEDILIRSTNRSCLNVCCSELALRRCRGNSLTFRRRAVLVRRPARATAQRRQRHDVHALPQSLLQELLRRCSYWWYVQLQLLVSSPALLPVFVAMLRRSSGDVDVIL